jgi:heme/copper-type cytochrome/quinol oxidase subunit 2
VSQLHGKIDMIPGQTNTLTLEAGQVSNYQGECAEYCGTQHAKMDYLYFSRIAPSPNMVGTIHVEA